MSEATQGKECTVNTMPEMLSTGAVNVAEQLAKLSEKVAAVECEILDIKAYVLTKLPEDKLLYEDKPSE